jgi:hypothetical protein
MAVSSASNSPRWHGEVMNRLTADELNPYGVIAGWVERER